MLVPEIGKQLIALKVSHEEVETLAGLKNKFTTVIGADYQMTKLTPYWGSSAQPGATQKLTHDLFGIVNHATGLSTVYLFDERAGPKNTDHTISYLTLPRQTTRMEQTCTNLSR